MQRRGVKLSPRIDDALKGVRRDGTGRIDWIAFGVPAPVCRRVGPYSARPEQFERVFVLLGGKTRPVTRLGSQRQGRESGVCGQPGR